MVGIEPAVTPGVRISLLALALMLTSGCEGMITRDHARPPVAPVPSDGGGWRPPSPEDAGSMGVVPGPVDAGATPPPPPPVDAGVPGGGDDPLGPCSGTEAECLAARVINEYRVAHVHQGECNEPLRWNDTLGRMAHDHQSGPFVMHSGNGYVENVGQAYGVRETAEYIIEWEAGIEEHCGPDGSYTVSHHCATMYCNNRTIGVGVYESGETTYMTMVFGDENGNPSW